MMDSWNPKDNHRILIQALRCLGKEVANEAETPSWKQMIYDNDGVWHELLSCLNKYEISGI